MPKRIIRNRTNVKSAADGFAEYIAAAHRAVHALGLLFDRDLDGEVTQAEAVVLLHLARMGDSTINEVHRAFLHKRSTLTSIVDRLEKKGFVQRRIGESDRRNFALALTPKGTTIANRVMQTVSALHHAVDAAPALVHSTTRLLEKTATAVSSVYARAAAGTAPRS